MNGIQLKVGKKYKGRCALYFLILILLHLITLYSLLSFSFILFNSSSSPLRISLFSRLLSQIIRIGKASPPVAKITTEYQNTFPAPFILSSPFKIILCEISLIISCEFFAKIKKKRGLVQSSQFTSSATTNATFLLPLSNSSALSESPKMTYHCIASKVIIHTSIPNATLPTYFSPSVTLSKPS